MALRLLVVVCGPGLAPGAGGWRWLCVGGRRARQPLDFAQDFGTVGSGRGTEPSPCFGCSASRGLTLGSAGA